MKPSDNDPSDPPENEEAPKPDPKSGKNGDAKNGNRVLRGGRRVAGKPALTGAIVDPPPEDAEGRGGTDEQALTSQRRAIADAGTNAPALTPAETAKAARRRKVIQAIRTIRRMRNSIAVNDGLATVGWSAAILFIAKIVKGRFGL